MNVRSRLAVLSGALMGTAALMGLPLPAAHAAQAAVTGTTFSGQQVQLSLTATGLAADSAVLPDKLTATVGGQPVATQVTAVGGLKTAVTRTSVLVVDTSGSMAGAGIADARTAADAFLADVAGDVRVGLVAFSDSAKVLVPPTRDHAVVKAGLQQLAASGNTRLYDAVLTAEQQLGSRGERHLLLLSDGTDTASAATLAQVVSRLKADRVQLDAVAFRGGPGASSATDPLAQLASATSGKVFQAADGAQLAAAFAQVAHGYDQVLSVTFDVPAALQGTRAPVVLTLPTTTQVLTTTTQVDFPAAVASAPAVTPSATAVTPRASVPASPSAAPSPSATPSVAASAAVAVAAAPSAAPPAASQELSHGGLVVAVIAVGLGLFLFLLLTFDVGRASLGRMRTLRRIARFTLGRTAPLPPSTTGSQAHGVRESAITRTAVQLAAKVVERRNLEQRLRLMLDRAAIPLLPSEWLLVLAGAATGGTLLVSLLAHNAFVGVLVGGVVGGVAPHVVAKVKGQRRVDAFLEVLPDALQVTAGSLSTGYSLPQALDAIVRQGQDPIAGELGRALAQARLGIPIEDALQDLAERMQSKDFEWVVMAIRINREVGGSLAEVLTTVAATLREREQLRRHVRGLSAEGRLSAYILIAMPILLGGYLFMFRRPYIRPLYTQPFGIAMLAGAVLLVVTGAFWMRSLVKVEV